MLEAPGWTGRQHRHPPVGPAHAQAAPLRQRVQHPAGLGLHEPRRRRLPARPRRVPGSPSRRCLRSVERQSNRSTNHRRCHHDRLPHPRRDGRSSHHGSMPEQRRRRAIHPQRTRHHGSRRGRLPTRHTHPAATPAAGARVLGHRTNSTGTAGSVVHLRNQAQARSTHSRRRRQVHQTRQRAAAAQAQKLGHSGGIWQRVSGYPRRSGHLRRTANRHRPTATPAAPTTGRPFRYAKDQVTPSDAHRVQWATHGPVLRGKQGKSVREPHSGSSAGNGHRWYSFRNTVFLTPVCGSPSHQIGYRPPACTREQCPPH